MHGARCVKSCACVRMCVCARARVSAHVCACARARVACALSRSVVHAPPVERRKELLDTALMLPLRACEIQRINRLIKRGLYKSADCFWPTAKARDASRFFRTRIMTPRMRAWIFSAMCRSSMVYNRPERWNTLG